ncbi:amidase family protein [Oceanitalea stevensii]|uniref:amidase family protein n=1 Tax=Oceanitalea stevensii TaxID=2763072 RepID=UPI002044E11A|nr:amidase family protein [Oceanitalea stevensii]
MSAAALAACSVAAVPVTGALAVPTPAAAATSVHEEIPLDLATAGIEEIQAALAAGELTSVQLTRAYLERIEALSIDGPALNAVRSINPAALEQAAQRDAERAAGTVHGPLHGIPVLLKDLIDVAGMATTAGSVALASSYPATDAPVTAALEESGAIILGKVNLTEFANFMTSGMPGGYSSLGGQVLNPYDTSQSPSGSSAGSGSAAAAALATVTVGTETSGSILSPARANSTVGIKPTVGLISRTGIVPISATQDTAGPMTRSVYDAAALLTGMVTVDPEDPATADNPSVGVDFTESLSTTALEGARLGYVESTDPVYAAALETLEEQGATLVPVQVGRSSAGSILTSEYKRDLNAYLSRLPADAPMKTLSDIIEYNNEHAGAALKFGQTLLLASQEVDLEDPATYEQYTAQRDQLVSESREAIDSVLEEADVEAIVSASATTGTGASAGYPSVSVPAGYAENNRRPVNIVFLGTAWSEAELLALASDYEDASQAWRSPEEINPSLFRCTGISEETEWDESCAQNPPSWPEEPEPEVPGMPEEPEEPGEPTTPRTGFFLNDGWDAWADHVFRYGRFTDEVLIGDWDGDGTDTITLRRGREFHVSDAQRGGDADRTFTYGRAGDVVLVGDWDGDGIDTLAVRRGNEYHLKNTISGGAADVVVRYGKADDAVVVGDWDGRRGDTLAVRRGATYHVKNSVTAGDADAVITYGRAGDTVLAGDWDGDRVDTFAVRRGATYHVKNSLTGGDPDLVQTYGRSGDEVYVGDWNGDGTDTLGVRRAP